MNLFKKVVCGVLGLSAALVASGAWQPGLMSGSLSGQSSVTGKLGTYPAETNNVLSPVMASTTTGWGGNTTYVYWGQIYLDGSTYTFAESIDDAVWLKIDGDVVINNPTWNVVGSGAITRDAGWYDFEVRFYNGSGGAGPVNQGGWGTTAFGFGYNTTGKKTTSSADYTFPVDDGSMSLFRYDDGMGFADSVIVSGVPKKVKVEGLSHGYGSHNGFEVGQSAEFFAPDGVQTISEDERATCMGWKLYKINLETNERTLWREGTGNVVSDYRHPDCQTELEWQWKVEYRVTAAAGTGGAVEPTEQWVEYGAASEAFTATANFGFGFLSWTDGEGKVVSTAASVAVSVSAPMSLRANFSGTYYVSIYGADSDNGLTPDTAFLTIERALAAADAAQPTTIHVGPGTYTATNTVKQADDAIYAIYLDKPVHLIGTEGPANTVIDCSTTTARAGAKLVHADAMIAGFSFTNGCHNAKNRAIGIEGNAGILSNCWIKVRGQWARNGWILNISGSLKAYDIVMQPHTFDMGEGGCAVYMKDNAVLDGFTARNVVITGNGARQLLYMDGNARASDVLIADCRLGNVEVASLAPFVTVNGAGAVLADATIVNNNIMANNGAVQVYNSKAMATNCIVWANTSSSKTNPNIQGASNLARFFNSCCNEFAADNAQGNIIVDPQFVDAANGDYRLRSLSKAKDMGVVALRPAGGAAQFECAGDADTYVSASGEPLEATFTGYCAGEQGEVTALWDFGDGTTSTDWPKATHTYTTPGAYTVTLTLNDGVSAPAVYTFTKSLVCTPETCYMSTTGSNTYPYDTWEKATPFLQAALDVGSSKIVVTNGNYEIPAPVIGISRAVAITSVEGPEKTTFTSLGTTTCNHRNLTVGGSSDILISGFTFADGYAAGYNWTASIDMSAGTLTNCVFKNIRRVSRSAACYFYGTAKVFDCVFDGHGMTWSNDSATQSGVRIEGSAVLDRCEIFAFKIENGGESTVYDGESPVRIASATAVLRNSYVHHCTNGVPTSANVKNRGPVGLVNGRIENCTIVNNVCAGYGGGVWAIGGTVVNSIIWDNRAGMAGNDVYVRGSATPTFLYSCASDFTEGAAITGEGCTAKSPNFDTENPYHLTPLSTACLNTGTTNLTWMTEGALDKDRLPRVVVNGAVSADGVDMGCYEYQESTVVPLGGTIDVVGSASGRAPFTATLEVSIVGDEEGLNLVWDFGDGEQITGGKCVTNVFENPGSYTVTVHVSNSAEEEKDIAATTPIVVVPQVCYVSKEGKGIAPYMTWENAATNLHDAVELNPKTVFVSNGLYKISREICIQSDLELRSVNGPEVTIIDAQNLCRDLWMTDQAEGSVVDGFSLWRGTGNWGTKSNYARVEAGVLSHCILSNCATSVYRDSAVLVKTKGRMVDCVVDNFAMSGNADDAYFYGTVVQSGGIIERCTIQRYNYTNQGGGGNTHGAVHVEGTGIFRNCLVKDCVTTQGVNDGRTDVYRAAVLVSGQGVVENCTIVNSKSCQPGAGLTILSGTPTVRNCIVWGATLGDGTATTAVRVIDTATPLITYSCAPELTAGEGNTTADPQFRAKSGVPYRFGSGSPCYDSAQKLDWMDESAVDRLGNVRIYSVAPDMGCYESQSGGLMMFVR